MLYLIIISTGFLGCYISDIKAGRSIRPDLFNFVYCLVCDMCVQHCWYFLISLISCIRGIETNGEKLMILLGVACVDSWSCFCWFQKCKYCCGDVFFRTQREYEFKIHVCRSSRSVLERRWSSTCVVHISENGKWCCVYWYASCVC